MKRLNPPSRAWQAARFLGDALIAQTAFLGALLLRIHLPLPLTQGLLPAERISYFFSEWPVILAAQLLTLYLFGFYDPPRPRSRAELARRLGSAVAVLGLTLMAYYFLANRAFPRSVLILFVPLAYVLLLGWRDLLRRRYRAPRRQVAIVGCGPAAHEVVEKIRLHRWHGLEVAGFVPAPEATPGEAEAEERRGLLGPRLGEVDDLPELLSSGRVDDVILTSSTYGWQTRLVDQLSGGRPAHVNVLLLPGPFESLIGRVRYRWVQDVPLIEVVRDSQAEIHHPLKRLVDLTGALALLVLAAPVMLVVAAAVALTSPGPVLYRQIRVGRGRVPFTLWKFRTMGTDAEENSGEMLALPDDPRLTPIGGFLRRKRLDELPQLFNVLNGSMSLVGPRPERPGFVGKYLAEVPGYAERFLITPGLTGLAQVNGEYHSSAQNKLRYDLAYMANWSLWLDLSILLRTVKIVLTSQGT